VNSTPRCTATTPLTDGQELRASRWEGVLGAANWVSCRAPWSTGSGCDTPLPLPVQRVNLETTQDHLQLQGRRSGCRWATGWLKCILCEADHHHNLRHESQHRVWFKCWAAELSMLLQLALQIAGFSDASELPSCQTVWGSYLPRIASKSRRSLCKTATAGLPVKLVVTPRLHVNLHQSSTMPSWEWLFNSPLGRAVGLE